MENVSTCRCVLVVLISLQLLLTFTSHVVNAECYVGSINSTTSGKVPVISVLHLEACGPTPLPSTEAPSTTNAATNATTTVVPTNATTAAVITNATTAAANTTTAPLTTTAKPTPTTKPNTTDEIVTTPTPPAEDPIQRFRRDLVTPTPPPPPPTSCAYFKYFNDPVLKENGTWTANFSCVVNCTDGDDTVNGKVGKRVCCRTDGCNSLAEFMKREDVNYQNVSRCYKGLGNQTSGVKVSTCTDTNSFFCFNRTTTDDSGNITTLYSCSDKVQSDFCFKNNLTSGNCTKDPKTNTTSCCCLSEKCNYFPATPSPSPKPSPEPSPSSHGKSIITGLVFMGFFIGFIAGVALMCYCFKKKRPSEGIDFNYTRITADSTEDADY